MQPACTFPLAYAISLIDFLSPVRRKETQKQSLPSSLKASMNAKFALLQDGTFHDVEGTYMSKQDVMVSQHYARHCVGTLMLIYWTFLSVSNRTYFPVSIGLRHRMGVVMGCNCNDGSVAKLSKMVGMN